MRRTLILLASLSIMVLGLWGTTVILLDEERLRSVVVGHLEQQTGRKLEIRGTVAIRLFPRLHVQAEDVRLAAPEGFDGPELLSADQVTLSVRLLPLVRGRFSPGEVAVSGATLNLHTAGDGRTTVDGLMSGDEHPGRRSAELLSTRQMQLEDVRIVISDGADDRSDTLRIDYVELDRFAFDQALDFRFHGNFGDPPLFSAMEVQGLLYIPSTRQQPMRLANMRMTGSLARGGGDVELLGHVSLSSLPPLALRLADGRLNFEGRSFDVELAYEGLERPRLQMLVQGESMVWPPVMSAGPGSDHALRPYLLGMDLDLAASVERGTFYGVAMDEVGVRLQLTDGIALLEAFDGRVPGGVLSGKGRWDLGVVPAQGRLDLELAVDDVARVLASLAVPQVVEGAGYVHWTMLRSPSMAGEGALASGRFELWDGQWLAGEGPGEQVAFDRLAGDFRLLDEVFDVTDLSLKGAELDARGWLSLTLREYLVGGQLVRADDGREVDLAGPLQSPRMSDWLADGGERDRADARH